MKSVGNGIHARLRAVTLGQCKGAIHIPTWVSMHVLGALGRVGSWTTTIRHLTFELLTHAQKLNGAVCTTILDQCCCCTMVPTALSQYFLRSDPSHGCLCSSHDSCTGTALIPQYVSSPTTSQELLTLHLSAGFANGTPLGPSSSHWCFNTTLRPSQLRTLPCTQLLTPMTHTS
jgi:hypothetical protein